MKPAVCALVLLAGCARDRDKPGSGLQAPGTGLPVARGPKSEARDQDWFIDRAKASGLDFVHVNGISGKFYYPEIIAPGVAMLDYDRDGDLDVYLVQGQMLGTGKPLLARRGPTPLEGRLYRNDLELHADGRRTMRFTDVTDASRIAARGYGMGVTTGDFDNDGCIDLYLTNLGPNQMWRNNCDGTFADVSRPSGVDDSGWSVSAAFLDFDRDGWLDLYVGHYVDWSIKGNTACFSSSGRPEYCSPNVYRAQPSRLYRNNRNGTFTDVTSVAGMAREFGPSLGVVTGDVNGDGWIDIYVANDGQPNQLWINQRDSTFKSLGLLSGAALSAHGKPKAGMGVDAGDFDNDGDEDLFVTNLTSEGNDLYVNDGSGVFEDSSARSGLGSPSLGRTGFGTAWFDFDNDGWLDVLVVSGAVQTIEAQRQANDPFPLRQRKQLFRNLGDGRFEEVTNEAGAVFQAPEVSRGAAFGDIDNDGDADVLVGNAAGPVRLLINQIGNRNHWVGLRLVGARPRPGGSKDPPLPKPPSPVGRGGSLDPPEGRDMLGARVEILRKDGSSRVRRVRADGSYASANDPRVLVGLGGSTEAPRVRVRWPSSVVEEWSEVPIDRWTTLREREGPG